jgi:hypothetical protein
VVKSIEPSEDASPLKKLSRCGLKISKVDLPALSFPQYCPNESVGTLHAKSQKNTSNKFAYIH